MLTRRGNAASLASGAGPLPVVQSRGSDNLCGQRALLKNVGHFPDVSGQGGHRFGWEYWSQLEHTYTLGYASGVSSFLLATTGG